MCFRRRQSRKRANTAYATTAEMPQMAAVASRAQLLLLPAEKLILSIVWHDVPESVRRKLRLNLNP